jgi:nucleoside-diphosphate-sugar epimerase
MRILISGAAGFLASHLTDLLLSQGHTVVGLDNFITGKPTNIAHLRGRADYTFIEQDVIEPFEVPGEIDRPDHHLVDGAERADGHVDVLVPVEVLGERADDHVSGQPSFSMISSGTE